MTARVGRAAWLVVRPVIRAVKKAHDEQVAMFECVLLTSRAAPATTTGPLQWVPSLGGYRLVGSYLVAEELAGALGALSAGWPIVYDPAHEHAGAGAAAAWA